MGQVIINSLLIASATAILSLLIGFPTALFISRLSRKWQVILIVAIILPYWTNFLVRTYAWLVLLNNIDKTGIAANNVKKIRPGDAQAQPRWREVLLPPFLTNRLPN